VARAFGGALTGIRILVGEDDEDVREMSAMLLESCGARVTIAKSGNAGWQTFQANRYDVVISDIEMPDGDGYELIRRIRALPPEDGGLTPAIAMSGNCGVADSLGVGFHVHLVKPADPLELVELARSFVCEGNETSATWTVSTPSPDIAVLTLAGHPTADDVRAATRALAQVLEHSARHVVADIREVTGFDLSGGSVAERTMWNVRRQMKGVTLVGGSWLARLIARTVCVVLGISCDFAKSV
jgi:CheY-like chemotaxis protein